MFMFDWSFMLRAGNAKCNWIVNHISPLPQDRHMQWITFMINNIPIVYSSCNRINKCDDHILQIYICDTNMRLSLRNWFAIIVIDELWSIFQQNVQAVYC